MDYGFFASDGIDQNPVHRISIMLKLLKPSKFTATKATNKIRPKSQKSVSKFVKTTSEKSFPKEKFLLAKVYKVRGDYLFLNIGTVNGLTQGAIFELYQLNKNNDVVEPEYKGRVKVFRAYRNAAAVETILKADSFYIKTGDVIALKRIE